MPMKGHTPGGLVSLCRNVHSRVAYYVSTVFQEGDACWTTCIFLCSEHRHWFGLRVRLAPDVSQQRGTYMRNSETEAHQVHSQVEEMVTSEQEDIWSSVGPDPMPPDGFNEGMQRRFEEQWGASLSPDIRARFRKKDKPIREYNKLRPSVGAAVGNDGDYCEAVAHVVVSHLLDLEVADVCKRLRLEERGLFMTAYAAYLTWLAMKGVEMSFPPDSWGRIAPILNRETSKQPWFQAKVMSDIFEALVKCLPIGDLGAWPDVVTASMTAGHDLMSVSDFKFILYVQVASENTLQAIARLTPTG